MTLAGHQMVIALVLMLILRLAQTTVLIQRKEAYGMEIRATPWPSADRRGG